MVLDNIRMYYSLKAVELGQASSIDPYCKLSVEIKYDPIMKDAKNQTTIREISGVELLCFRGMLYVSDQNGSNQREIGIAESRNSYLRLYRTSEQVFELILRISIAALHQIESLRNGEDLRFRFSGNSMEVLARVNSNIGQSFETIQIFASGDTFTYPQSSWVKDLSKTTFGKIELLEIPKIDLPQNPISTKVNEFIHTAEEAMKHGDYDGVLGECRKAVAALDEGIIRLGKNLDLSGDEIKTMNGNNDIGKRDIVLHKLLGHEEKGKRLNEVNKALFRYLSLDPHQSEYDGLHFSKFDAIFALRTTITFVSTILNYMSMYEQRKTNV